LAVILPWSSFVLLSLGILAFSVFWNWEIVKEQYKKLWICLTSSLVSLRMAARCPMSYSMARVQTINDGPYCSVEIGIKIKYW
jgi:hypothetical protein